MSVEELAQFIWEHEYDPEEYPWARLGDDERAYYRDCARHLLDVFTITPKS